MFSLGISTHIENSLGPCLHCFSFNFLENEDCNNDNITQIHIQYFFVETCGFSSCSNTKFSEKFRMKFYVSLNLLYFVLIFWAILIRFVLSKKVYRILSKTSKQVLALKGTSAENHFSRQIKL